ncbi:MAG: hypothetical protein M3P85_09215 [Actinomycetota bacterium]|nr:hypothetical protein [Actinomycetota bacterium]
MISKAMSLAAAFAVAVSLPRCGDTRSEDPEAQPAPGVTRFAEGEFDQLPRYPRSDPASDRTEKADSTARSFKVRNASPQQILDFYASRLEGWRPLEAPREIGKSTYRGVWTKEDRRLTVSAAPAPGFAEPDEVVSQYSITLGPD